VADDGFLIFTTQGLASRQYLGNPEVPESGIWLGASSEHGDLSTQDCGQAVVRIPFVLEQVLAVLTGGYPWLIRPSYWWTHQDVHVTGHLPPVEQPSVRSGKLRAGS
jgi:hypothetical protein